MLGNNALSSITKRYSELKDDEITRRLLNNLAVYTLSGKKYFMESYRYSSTSIGLPHSTQHLYIYIYIYGKKVFKSFIFLKRD